MTEEHVIFTADGLELEGILSIPDVEPPFPAVAVCHPHPQYGGDMNNNVVQAICHALTTVSVSSLRFNFRGVGRSQGSYSKGIGEQEDVKAALAYLSKQSNIDPERIGLAGYSFGTMVVLPVALSNDQVRAVALISPVISPDYWQQLNGYERPKLILSGSCDFLVSSRDMQQRMGKFTDPDLCEVIPGADHFWWGYEGEISGKISTFFSNIFEV